MKMIKPVVLLILAAILLCGTASAQDSGFGLGVILGEPTGISGKLWLGGKTAIDGATAWSSLLNADGNFRNVLHKNGHGFIEEQRKVAYTFLDEKLKP